MSAPEGPVASEAWDPDDALQRVAEAAHQPVVDAWDQLDERIQTTMLQALRQALETHARLRGEAGVQGPPPAERAQRLRALRAYRHGMADEVLPALELALQHHKPTLLAVRSLEQAVEEAFQRTRALEFRMQVRWGAGALDVVRTDGPSRRVMKRLARVFSAARKPDHARVAPLRAEALRHLHERVGPSVDGAAGDLARAWALWVARLEHAWAAWAAEALPVLTHGDLGAVSAGPEEPAESSAAGGAGGAVEADGSDEGGEGGPERGDGSASARRDGGWQRLVAAADALEQALTELVEATPDDQGQAQARERLGLARLKLSSDVRTAGSFVHRAGDAPEGPPPLRQLQRAKKTYDGWDHQAAARLTLYRSFLELLLGGSAVLERLDERVRGILVEPLKELEARGADLASLMTDARSHMESGATHLVLDDLRNRADAAVARALEVAPHPEAVAEELEDVIADTVDALQGIVRQSPEVLVLHRLDHRMPAALRPEETRQVRFRERARQSLDAMRIERVRRAVTALLPTTAAARTALLELPGVIEFAFEAATDEVEDAEETSSSDEDEGTSEQRAARLAMEALERASDVLHQVPRRTEEGLETMRRGVAAELVEGAGGLLERLGAGRMQGQLLHARSHVADFWSRAVDRFGPRLRRIARFGRFHGLRARRSMRRAHRAVQALLGDATPSGGRAARTVRAFAHADSGPGHVPLVYQRLFALDPVVDPDFLVGRAAELADVLKRYRRWRDEDEVPVVVRGYPGAGVTSFLTGCARMLEERGGRVVHVPIPQRVLEERVLCRHLSEVIGAGPAEDLDALGARILASSAGTLPDVVVVDGLEHLFLRIPGGTELLERLLTVMSETEPRMLWIGGVSQPAWQLISKVEPTAVSQVDDLLLGPLTVERVRETIMQRHRRSGLRARFVEPKEGKTLLRRRARRLRGTEEHQRLLADHFFEQLHRISDGNMKLALFHWMLAADFDSSEGEVLLHPLEKPDFSVLEGLDANQNFTLKALLEHRSLALAEHQAVFRLPRQESYQIFESLQNRQLVEMRPSADAWDTPDDGVEPAVSYRIRPLLVGATTAHLRRRNIVH